MNRITPDPGTARLTDHGDNWQLALEGEHDLSTVPLLEGHMEQVRASGTTVIIDLSAAAFIDCAVVGWLVRWSRRARGTDHLHLAVVAGEDGARAKRVLDLLPIDRIVPCFPVHSDAMNALRRGS